MSRKTVAKSKCALCGAKEVSEPRGEGTAVRAANVTLAALPAFDGPVQFYPKLPGILPKLWKWTRGIDVLHCRIPSPAAIFAFELARLSSRPAFVLIVGDLRALLPTMPYTGVKRLLWRAYTAFEDRNVQWMADRCLYFGTAGMWASGQDGRPAMDGCALRRRSLPGAGQ